MGLLSNISADSPFSLDNIPFGVFSIKQDPTPRCATAIGEFALDLCALSKSGFFQDALVADALSQATLNKFAALPAKTRSAARDQIISACKDGKIPDSGLHKLSEVKMHLPVAIPEYTDFFCSLEHCTNCMPITNSKIPENFYHAPSAYNGRASSVIPSPSLVRRPRGVYWKAGTKEPTYGLSQFIDFELEMGYIVSKPVPYGETITVDDAPDHIFGFVLLNDWSSRDIQIFEMPPLGPFNSKSFGTTISPWIITLDALKAFQCAPKHNTHPLEHLRFKDFEHGTFNIKLAASLERDGKRHQICTSNLRYLYWTPYQQITHHASANCGLRTGDLMGTGTVSGDGKDEKTGKKFELGCLFEATQHASQPIALEGGGKLGYLEDGDSVILSAWCEDSTGRPVLGFGECRGKLVGPEVPIS
ncbi:fumarylacetoacetase [Cladophialophora bantiana CBS 173.52]|uniref:Fumarylacetoacetase n=1 Tax=Cladophialophora bantiana (strain ATCC 10958 / CBS 173.52 / CDC B-1940 / NIH 8579) TaxID=1442370 RepID=A0A0D2H506_CLAB1|nr:fumarylacetoacetase [Cladophialophora bantiana CBS 173.52]KIW88388.1 fumarylacetoacetase [Cladophialophora bantiana CBS 173.52]